MDFADKLRPIRHARGLRQIELAERCGNNISNRDISLMETGKIIPVGEWEARIKAALNWPENDDVFVLLAAQLPQEQMA